MLISAHCQWTVFNAWKCLLNWCAPLYCCYFALLWFNLLFLLSLCWFYVSVSRCATFVISLSYVTTCILLSLSLSVIQPRFTAIYYFQFCYYAGYHYTLYYPNCRMCTLSFAASSLAALKSCRSLASMIHYCRVLCFLRSIHLHRSGGFCWSVSNFVVAGCLLLPSKIQSI